MDDYSKISFYGESNMGRIRTNNEDSFVVQKIWDNKHIVAVAIDGVGGYEGGEVAADIAAKSIVRYLEDNPNGERQELLRQAVIYANNEIYAARNNNPQLSQMSCVLTAALLDLVRHKLSMAHIGDTRLYRYYKGKLVKLSHDHSLVGFREEIGELSEEEAMNHPQRNVISRDVGSKHLSSSDEEYVESELFHLDEGSQFLLCSDGLTDMVTSSRLIEELQKNCTVEEKTKALIDAANIAGGKDNVTIVIVEYGANETIEKSQENTFDQDDTIAVPDEIEKITIIDDTVTIANNKPNGPKVLVTIIFTLVALVAGFIAGVYYERALRDKMANGSIEEVVCDTTRAVVDTTAQPDSVVMDVDTIQKNSEIVDVELNEQHYE